MSREYWKRIFIRQEEIRNIPAHAPREAFKVCRQIARAATEEEFGVIRRVGHKNLTDEAKFYIILRVLLECN
jgi:hypothetical protein